MNNIIFFSILFGLAGARAEDLRAPFEVVKLDVPTSLKIEVLTPSLVSKDAFLKSLIEDCQEFKETVLKHSQSLNKDTYHELLTSPLAYTMRADYEVQLKLSGHRTR